MAETRIETDSIGEMEVAADRYWGFTTDRYVSFGFRIARTL